jgi:ribonuclease HI
MRVQVYTDGGCRGNQARTNVGAWACYLVYGQHTREHYGAERNTTNNKMELMGAIMGLRSVKNKNVGVDLYTDSAYVYNGINQWIYGWLKRGWVNSKKEPVANKELWLALLEEKKKFSDLTINKVKGHATNEGNNRADFLVNKAMDELK